MKNQLRRAIGSLCMMLLSLAAFAQTTTLNYSGSIVNYVVPAGVTSLTIETFGAQGGSGALYGTSFAGGKGAYMKGTFSVTPGESLKVLVGQMGGSSGGPHGNENGGGGGSFVVRAVGNVPLIIAGGGGGGASAVYGTSCTRTPASADGQITTSGVSVSCSVSAAGGTNGSGGVSAGSYQGGAGGGFNTNGGNGGTHCSTAIGGSSFLNGGAGGAGNNCYNTNDYGGFGGGGGGMLGGPGGGGGYSGGASAGAWSSFSTYGGGGGSYNVGTNQVNVAGSQNGDGKVIITVNSTAASAINLDGNDDYLRTASPFYQYNKEITVEAWINTTQSVWMGQSTPNVDDWNTSNVWLWHIKAPGQGMDWYVNDGGVARAISLNTLSAGWHHIATTANACGMFIYVDGVLTVSSATGISSGIKNVASSVLDIGKDPRYSNVIPSGTDRYTAFSADEVRIWSRSLSIQEINAHKSCELIAGQMTGLQEYYQFNQGSSNADNTAITTITDASGNARNASINNLALTGAASNFIAPGGVTTGNNCAAFSLAAITGNGTLGVGGTLQLADATAGGTWSSNATGVATVNASGLVTGVSAGTAVITYTIDCGTSVNVTVTVSSPATALKFDPSLPVGDNSRLNYVSVANPFETFQKEITVEFWMNPASANLPFGSLMGQSNNNSGDNNSGGEVWLLHPNENGNMTFFVNDGGTFRAVNANIIANSWHHYAAVASATSTKFYVDGVLVATGPGVSGTILNNPTSVIHIGKDVRFATRYAPNNDPLNRYATMTLDELRIWSRALCAEEINNNKNVEINPTGQNGLQEYYRFNQGLAGANNTAITTVTDISGNGRDGVLNNFTLNGAASNWVVSGSTNTGIVNAFLAPTAAITGTTSVCISGTTTLANSITGGVWTSSNTGVATINPSTGVVNAVSAGTTTITYTTACGGISTAIVTVNALPTPVVTAGGPTTFCTGGSVLLTVSGNGNALTFNGTNRVTVSSTPTLPVGNSAYTIETWVKPKTVSGVNGLIGWGNYGTTSQVNALRFNGPTTLINYWWNNDLVVTIPNILDGKWHHIAATYNGTTRAMYLDGVLVGSDIPSGHNVPANTAMTIAETWPAANEYFDGSMDEVRIWNVGKTQAQIAASMNGTVPVNSANLVAYYKLDEGTGTTTADATGNGNNGTLTTSPVWMVPSTSPVGSSFSTISWNIGGGTTSTITATTAGSYTATVTNAAGCSATSAPITVNVNPLITATTTKTDVDCAGAGTGSITVSAAGGTAPYQYSKDGGVNYQPSNVFSGLTAGNYTVFVKDVNNCPQSVGTVTIATVVDNIAPVLVGAPAPNITVACDAVPSAAIVTATDNCATPAVSYFQVPNVAVNTVHNWQADGNLNDLSGTANGTAVGVVNYAPGLFGSNAFSFSGSSYINIGTAGSISGSGEFAVGAWIKTSSNAGMSVIQQRDGNINGQYILNIGTNHNGAVNNAGKVYFLVGGNPGFGDVFSTINVNDGKWHHIMGERSGTAIRIYIDGVLNATGATPAVINMNADAVISTAIGKDIRDNTKNFNGLIDAVKVYNTSACVSAFERDRFWITADASSNYAASNQNLHIIDATAPVITCPANITVNAVSGCGATVTYSATAVDNCSTANISYSIASGSLFPVGTTSVTVTATDACGNSSQCTFEVSVNDVTAPTITCPANISVNASSVSGAVVTYSTPIGTDNCAGVTLTRTAGLASGSTFPLGTTTVTYRATDASGNFADCSFTVTVAGAMPVIVLPSNITVANTPGLCSAVVNFTASDATGIPASTISYSIAPGSVFPVGTTTVTATATNSLGSSSGSFTVTVTALDTDGDGIPDACDADADNDGIPNTLECNKSNFFWSNAPTITGLTTATGTINGIGYTYSSSTQVFTTPDMYSNATFPASYHVPNTTTIKNIAVNSNTLTFASPMTNPVLVFASIGQGGVPVGISFSNPVQVVWSTAVVQNSPTQITGTEGYAIVRMMGTFNSISFNYLAAENWCNFAFGADFQSCGDTDGDGIPDYLDTDSDGDGCPDAIEGSLSLSISNVVNGRLTGGVDSRGIPLIANGGQGVGTSQNFAANCFCQPGLDETKPTVITKNITVNLNAAGNASITGAQVDNGSSDNCGIASLTVSPNSFNCSNIGANTVTLTVTDTQGNISTGTAIVTVADNIPPAITCPANITATATSASGAVVTYAAPVGTDNCSGATTALTAGLASGSTFPIGTTTVTHTVTDAAGLTASCSFTITVSGLAPVISCPANITVSNDPGQCSAVVTYAATETTGIPASTITYSIPSGSTFPLGTTTVTATATNAVGSSTCTFTVTVKDVTPPTIICAADITVNSTSNNCNANVTVPKPTVSDNCGGSYPNAPFASNHSNLMLWMDATRYSVSNGSNMNGILTDASGYSRSLTTDATFETSGINGRPAVRYNNNRTVVNAPFSTNGNTFIYLAVQVVNAGTSWASILDHHSRDMGVALEQNGLKPSNIYHFQTGNDNNNVEQSLTFGTNYIMACTITGGNLRSFTLYKDNNGVLQNLGTTSNSSFNVQIGNNHLYIGKSDNNEFINMKLGEFIYFQNSLPVTESSVVNYLYDKWFSPGVTVTNSINGTNDASGSYPVGTTNIIWTAKDAAGNTSTCNQTVTVVDNQPPTISCPSNVNAVATSAAGAIVTYITPVGTDNCSGATTVMTAGLPSGSTFPIGTTPVTYTVTDAAGLTTSCTFNVTVVGVAPVVVCPANIIVSNTPGLCGATVTYTATETTGIPASTITYSIPSGSFFNVGVTTVTVTATNIIGTSTCSFTVRVNDTQLPTVVCQPVTVVLDANGQGTITAAQVNNGSSDNCGIASMTLSKTTFTCADLNQSSGALTLGTGSDGVTTNTTASLPTGNSARTFSGWVNQTQATNIIGLVHQGNFDCTGLMFGFGIASGNAFFWGGCRDFMSNLPVTMNQWTYIALTYDGNNNYVLYKDNLSQSFTIAGGLNTQVSKLFIGHETTNNGASYRNQFAGSIDEVKVYNRALNAAEIAQDRAGNNQSGLVAYYPFNEGSGTVIHDAAGTNTATLINPTGSNWTTRNSSSPATTTLTVTDVNGNSASCVASVTVIDNIAPVLVNCPANINIVATSAAGAAFTYTAPTATDNCSAVVTRTAGLASGSTFPIGVTTVTHKATDASGNATSCSFTVTVIGVAPVITCPANITVNAAAGRCGENVSFAATETTAIPASVITYTENGNPVSSGSFFSVGVHTIVATATNAVGSVNCSFTITVEDKQFPVLVGVPANVTVECNAVPAAAVVTATDNCSTSAPAVTETRTNGNCAGNYTLTRVWSTTDASGNTTTGTQVITVQDTQAPVITCPGNISVPAATGLCTAVVNYAATATDNCSGAVITYSIAPGSVFNVGTQTVVVTATDACGNQSSCSFTVTVTDTQFPNVITQNITVYLDVNGQASITPDQVNNGSTDNCGIATMTVSPSSFNCANVSSLVNINKQTIVTDATWSESTTTYSTGNYCVTGVWNGVSSPMPALNSYSIAPTMNAYSITPISGTQGIYGLNGVRFFRKTFTLGTLTDIKATLQVAMDNGAQIFINGVPVALKGVMANTFNGSTPVQVVLNSTGPNVNGGTGTISFDNITNTSASGLFVVGTNEIVLALANCDGGDRGAISFKATIETSTGGPNPVVLTVTDVNGNTSSATALVTVVDNIAPVLVNCPTDIEVYATSASGAAVTYTAPTATDNCSAVVTRTAGLASGSTFPIGTTTVTHKATDPSGNSVNCSFNVIVSGLAPVITCPPNIVVTASEGQCGANVTYAATETTAIPASTITYSIAPGSFFPVGTTTVTATATNPVGTVSCTFTVTVTDDEKPTITPPANMSVTNDAGICGAAVALGTPVTGDNCEVATVTNDAPAVFPVGTTTVTWTVTDIHNNSSSATQTVVVTDNEVPLITTNGNKSVTNDAGQCGAVVMVSATAADNCGVGAPTGVRSDELLLTDPYPVGTTTITWSVTDIHGNAALVVNQTVEVSDTEVPVVITHNITVQLNAAGSVSITPGQINNGTTDNCGIAGYSLSKTSFDCSNVGNNTVTLSVTDIHGNTSSATAVVTVEDHVPPVVITKNLTVYVDANGHVAVTPQQVNNGSTDNCGIASMSLSKSSFDCSDVVTSAPAAFNNGAMAFDGQDDYVQINGNIPGGNNFSFSTWFYPTNGSNGKLISSNNFEVCVCGGAIEVYTSAGGGFGAFGLSMNTWHNLVVSYSFPQGKLYVDGVLKMTFNAGPISTIVSPRIGRHIVVNCCKFPGFIDEMSTWNKTLTPADISNIQTQPLTGTEAGLTGYWSFDEGSGNVVIDHSSGGHNGTMMNMNAATAWSSFKAPVGSSGSASASGTGVILTVTDVNGNSASAPATITVLDNINPVIDPAPADVTVECNAVPAAAVLNATDNCSAVVTMTEVRTNGNCPNNYTLKRTWTATDPSGNHVSVSQTITVQDTQAPVLSASPADVTVECNAVPEAAVLTATDNCDAPLVVYNEVRTNGSSVNNYTLTRTWTTTDACGNTSSWTQVITVQDTQAPVITSTPANIAVNTDSNVCGAVVNFEATATDVCGPVAITYSQNPGTLFALGTTVVTVTATDPSGNQTTSSFTVTVTDIEKPVVLTQNITVDLDQTGHVSITAAQVNNGSSDACGIATISVSPNSFDCSKQGPNTVTLTVTDVNGNVSTGTAVVSVQDKLGPVPTVSVLPSISGQCSAAIVIYKAKCTDNCRCCRVVCHCKDNCRCHRLDSHPIRTSSHDGDDDDDDDDNDCDYQGGDVLYQTTPTAMDNCSGLITGVTTDPLSYTTQGTHVIHWSFTDAKGNTTIQEQLVIVNDNLAPVPRYTSLPTITGQCSVTISIANDKDDDDDYEEDHGDDHEGDDNHDHWNEHHGGAPWAKDNCAGWIKGTTTDPLTYTTQGTYVIHWKFDDGHGNITMQNQTVIVKDVTAPKPTVSKLPTVTADCSATVTAVPTAKDNCAGIITGTTTSPLTYNTQGTYTIVWSYTDGHGNTATQNQTVVIKDNQKPVISKLPDMIVNCGSSNLPSVTGTPVASDNCGVVSVTYTDAVSSNKITRTWKAVDAAGNFSTSTQVLTPGLSFTTSVSSVPTSNVNTGGINTNLYLGYGAQSTTLTVASLPSAGAPYTYSWSGSKVSKLSSTAVASPVFTPTEYGYETYTVMVTNKYGCTATASISICVTDIRVPGSNGTKVYMCHTPKTKNAVSQTLEVLVSQVASHLNGGCGSNGNDRLGSCGQTPCNNTALTSVSTAVTATAKDNNNNTELATTEEELKVTVMPNPSTTYFTLKLESRYQTPVNMRVMDGTGRVVDAKSQIGSNSTIQIGHNYSSGTYYAELIQGTKRKVVQLIKARG